MSTSSAAAPARAGIPGPAWLPTVILGLLLAGWVALGLWICLAAPFNSGTDESTRYVAFAAAANRWATEEDAAARGVDHYYHPPLYFLLLAPFYGDEPSFVERYPAGPANDPNYPLAGSNLIVSKEYLARVSPELLRLYRTAKLLSLAFGVGVLACLIATLRTLFAGPCRRWLVLGGTAPLILLPQFLYYQTLVNNDALVNFLCALAVYCFVAAVGRSGRGDAGGATRLSLACAAAAGLGLFTKSSAVVVVPLLPILAALPLRSAAAAPSERAARSLRLLLVLAAVTVACGGWWHVRLAAIGDPGGVKAVIAAHPWDQFSPTTSWGQAATLAGRLARSYVALFAGALYGIPDVVYALYLAVPATFAVALLAASRHTRGRPASAAPAGSPPRLIWWALAGIVVVNLTLVYLYNLTVHAPYGRLLFPSLVASHTLFTLLLRGLTGADCRRLAASVLALTVFLGGLFAWTFLHRMVPAVVQPAENLVPLGVVTPGAVWRYGPIWSVRMEQPMLLPPGRLTGFRLFLEESSSLPQFGAVLEARLLTGGGSGQPRELPFKPCRVGDNGSIHRSTDLELEEPFDSPGAPATLLLQARKPWFSPPGTEFHYVVGPPGLSDLLQPLIADGEPMAAVLALTAVYR